MTSPRGAAALLCFFFFTLGLVPGAYSQYCITNLHQNACGANGVAFLDTLVADGQRFAPQMPIACAGNATYISFLTDTANVLTMTQGGTVTLRFRSTGTVNISGWVDFNRNNAFEANEWINMSRNSTPGNIGSVTFTVPFVGGAGDTRFRVRTRVIPSANGAGDACTRFLSGLTYDFNARILPGPQCAGVPDQPIILSSQYKLCPGSSANISLLNLPVTGGLSYQWETSTNGFLFSPVAGGTGFSTSISYAAMTTDTLYVRLQTECAASGEDNGSATIMLLKEETALCHCRTNLHTNPCDEDYALDTMSQPGTFFNPLLPLGCDQGTYVRLHDAPTEVVTVEQGSMASLQFRGRIAVSVSAYFDANRNGIFEPSEWTDFGRNVRGGVLTTARFFVPATTPVGFVRMRIRTRGAGPANGAGDACTPFPSGFTYDIMVQVLPGSACALVPANQTISLSNASICGFDSSAVTVSAQPMGVGAVLRWFISTDGQNYVLDSTIRGSRYMVAGTRMQRDSLFVRLEVSCAATGQSTTTAPVLVVKQPAVDCYCTQVHQNAQCGAYVSRLRIANTSINFTQRSCPRTYYRYPPLDSVTGTLVRGAFHAVTVQQRSNAAVNGSLWVDLNQDGAFSANEWYDLGRNIAQNTNRVVNIFIPLTAKLGATTMRIRLRGLPSENDGTDACTNFNSGSTLDLPVSIGTTVVSLDKGADVDKPARLVVFPNPSDPTNGLVHLSGYDPTAKDYTLLDAMGRVVQQAPLPADAQLQLPATPGLYWVVVAGKRACVVR